MFWFEWIEVTLISAAMPIMAGLAAVGLLVWRFQLSGRKEYDVAWAVLRAAHRLRNAIRDARIDGFVSWEVADRPKAGAETTEESHIRDAYWAQARRLEAVIDARSALDSAGLDAELLWEDKIREYIKALLDYTAELMIRHKLYHSEALHEGSLKRYRKTKAYADLHPIAYSNSMEDPFADKVDEAVGKIVNELGRSVRSKGSFLSSPYYLLLRAIRRSSNL